MFLFSFIFKEIIIIIKGIFFLENHKNKISKIYRKKEIIELNSIIKKLIILNNFLINF